jgi:hypothetical protein
VSVPLAPRFILACLLSALAIASAGCGGDDEPSPTGVPAAEAPDPADFPEPGNGSIDEFIAEVGETNEVVAAPSGIVFEPGTARFGFGLFDVEGPQIEDADVAVYFQDTKGTGPIEGPFTARVESLEVQSPYKAQSALETDTTSVYIAEVPFEKSGEQRAVAVLRDDENSFSATNLQTVIPVKEHPEIPSVGDPAPPVSTPTLDDVGDVAEIDTRLPPSTMHEEDLKDVLGKKPVVLLFATPALCMSRVCGPVVDVTEQVKAEYSDDVAFIHMEIWEDNVYDPEKPNPRPQVEAFGLATEPWLFVIDENGDVATRIEGAFSPTELEDAINDVTS